MLPIHVALVTETPRVNAAELTRVAAALQKQAVRDFNRIWHVHASISAFARLEDVPLGYWPIIVLDNIHQPGAAGVHLDKKGQPFALVQNNSSWSLTASHECLEMLGDPFGNRLIAGQSPKPGHGRVEFLVEVCDPCEAPQFAYHVNGVLVSDFYTPHYFDPVTAAGARYSFTGAINAPHQLLHGGYLSWHEPISDHWWQAKFFGPQIEFSDLGILGRLTGSLREEINKRTTYPPHFKEGLAENDQSLVAAHASAKEVGETADSQAKSWRAQIADLMK